MPCPGCHLCLCVCLSGTFPRELPSSRHDQGGIRVFSSFICVDLSTALANYWVEGPSPDNFGVESLPIASVKLLKYEKYQSVEISVVGS